MPCGTDDDVGDPTLSSFICGSPVDFIMDRISFYPKLVRLNNIYQHYALLRRHNKY